MQKGTAYVVSAWERKKMYLCVCVCVLCLYADGWWRRCYASHVSPCWRCWLTVCSLSPSFYPTKRRSNWRREEIAPFTRPFHTPLPRVASCGEKNQISHLVLRFRIILDHRPRETYKFFDRVVTFSCHQPWWCWCTNLRTLMLPNVYNVCSQQ